MELQARTTTTNSAKEILKTLKSVQEYFESNGGTPKNIKTAEKAVKKASLGQYGICACGHIATSQEIHNSPFYCSKCKKAFI